MSGPARDVLLGNEVAGYVCPMDEGTGQGGVRLWFGRHRVLGAVLAGFIGSCVAVAVGAVASRLVDGGPSWTFGFTVVPLMFAIAFWQARANGRDATTPAPVDGVDDEPR